MDKTVYAPVCETHTVSPQTAQNAKKRLPPDGDVRSLAALYKVFGDETRIKILCCLYENELCVCDIAAALEMTVSAISHQLRLLKSSGLVKYRRNGRSIYYSLADSHVETILMQGTEHISEDRK